MYGYIFIIAILSCTLLAVCMNTTWKNQEKISEQLTELKKEIDKLKSKS